MFCVAWIASITLAAAIAYAVYAMWPAWETLFETYLTSHRMERLVSLQIVDRATLKQSLAIWALTATLIAVVLGVYLRMPMIAVVIAWLMYQGPRILLDGIIDWRERTLRNQLEQACFSLASGVKAGLSLPIAIERAASDSPPPLQQQLMGVVQSYRRGVPLFEALQDVSTTIQLETFSLVATALGVTLERGGNVAQALHRISHSIQETQRLEGRLRALTAAPRTSLYVLAVFPVIFLGGFAFIEPEAVGKLFSTFAGQIVFCVAVAIVFLSYRWGSAILRSVI